MVTPCFVNNAIPELNERQTPVQGAVRNSVISTFAPQDQNLLRHNWTLTPALGHISKTSAPLEKFPKQEKFSHSKIFCPAQVKAHTRNSGEIKRSQHLHRCALYVGLVLCASP